MKVSKQEKRIVFTGIAGPSLAANHFLEANQAQKQRKNRRIRAIQRKSEAFRDRLQSKKNQGDQRQMSETGA
jgi:hypothetical protein